MSLPSAGSTWGSKSALTVVPSLQVVDPRYVNAHQCTLDQDSSTQKILHRIKRSLALLEQGQYSKAHRTINPEGLSSEELSASAPRNIAWAAANTAGVVMFHAGEFSTADKLLRKALKHCEELTSNGLAQDAYCDLAACLSDVAVNVLKWKGQSEEAANLLKRALYMTERAYRPNYHLIESLRSNLAAAYLETDPEQARTVVEKSVKTRDAVQTTLSGGAAAMTDREKCGHARSLSVWSAPLCPPACILLTMRCPVLTWFGGHQGGGACAHRTARSSGGAGREGSQPARTGTFPPPALILFPSLAVPPSLLQLPSLTVLPSWVAASSLTASPSVVS